MLVIHLAVDFQDCLAKIRFQGVEHGLGDVPLFHQVRYKDFEQGVFQRASFEFMETPSDFELQDRAQWLQNEMQGAQLMAPPQSG